MALREQDGAGLVGCEIQGHQLGLDVFSCFTGLWIQELAGGEAGGRRDGQRKRRIAGISEEVEVARREMAAMKPSCAGSGSWLL